MLATLALSLFLATAHAEHGASDASPKPTGPVYSNERFTLDLPARGWSCAAASTDSWTCRHGHDSFSLAAEPRTGTDTFGRYENELRNPPDGSKVRSLSRLVILRHMWASAVHETGGGATLTRTLFTLGPNLKFTVIYTAPKDGFDALDKLLEPALETLRTHEKTGEGKRKPPRPDSPRETIKGSADSAD